MLCAGETPEQQRQLQARLEPLLGRLRLMLKKHNGLVHQFMSASDLEREHGAPMPNLKITFHVAKHSGIDRKVYNAPIGDIVAGLIPDQANTEVPQE